MFPQSGQTLALVREPSTSTAVLDSEAAQRELREETGLTASDWHELMRLHLSNSITDEIGIVYVATNLTQGKNALEETEDIQVRRLPLAEAVEMARRGEITDAMSAAALFRIALEPNDRAE